MIISASRRTDIPAFYTPWFLNRIKAGYVLNRNPYNPNQVSRISLKPKDVEVIVFWTRNPVELMPHLPLLDDLGYKYYFMYTITGYPDCIEPSVPRLESALDTISKLSEMIGPEKVIWRYDPVLLSNFVDINEHRKMFLTIASHLKNKVSRVTISFADFYQKTKTNLNAVPGLMYCDITKDKPRLYALSEFMAETSFANNIKIQSCAEGIDLDHVGIPHGACIDHNFIKEVFAKSITDKNDNGQRDECYCRRSIDIGMYNTCLHDCVYCYATKNKKAAMNNREKHKVHSPFLTGEGEGFEK